MPLFDRKDKSRYASFTRRTLMVSGGMTAVLCALGGRLYQLQIRDGALYRTAAEDNRVNERLVAPPRGRILDRFASELANNRRNYRLLFVAEQANEKAETALNSIARVIQLSDQQKKRVLHDLSINKKFVPVVVAENLSWEAFALLNQHLPYLPGVQPDVGETRSYPYAEQLSHLLGYVAPVSPDDKKGGDDDDPLLDLPGFRIGKRGIEKQFDTEIRGEAGASRVEVNAYGRVIRELSRDPPVPGKDVYLTIDRELQSFTDQRLAGESAACVVMDVATGDVLALSSTPGFDPNLFNVGIGQDQWRALMTDDHKPLINKAIAGEYPPGSTFKPAMAMAAVQNGLSNLQVNCSGALQFGNNVFHCWAWKKGGHGHVDLKRGIQVSCDIFFYEVARHLGIDKMHDAAVALGFSSRTGIEIPSERPGLIPSTAWKLQKTGVPWQPGDSLSAGIGQGYVLATPIQLCTAAARIASGKSVSPRIVRVVGNQWQPRPSPAPLPFPEESFAAVQEGMNLVANVPGGTAYAWRITEPGFEMAGKTGTAQVRVITKAERESGVKNDASLPWALRDHGLFIAFAPVAQPKYACACVVEHNAPPHPQVQVARDVLLFAQQRDILGRRAAYPLDSADTTPQRDRA
ncbi:MAG: penicillin-binding protein 2 [Alphaproteobacteria bacterium]|nr:penicillin-binding protein 2 [Alphaproteobacteria bacterium]MBV9695220.1 penicillin-binding protein 2 [Alphaproteobacteria bacterium]